MQALVLSEPTGQGWTQFGELGLAFVLSTCIGLEREIRQKAAGLRTHTLVGVGSALFMLVSKYAFTDVLGGDVVLDPSRVAAQIVSGIGFIGGGLIFVRRDTVSGLTTAASVWLTAAIGSAAGGGLPLLAAATTLLYFAAVPGYTALVRRTPGSRLFPARLTVDYRDGQGVLRELLAECTARGFLVAHLTTKRAEPDDDHDRPGVVRLWLQVQGRASVTELAADLAGLPGVIDVDAGAERD
jgi:putative Mg2+ transporter-C (MgtC) family protein